MKVAILTRPDDRSPRILAESLQSQLRSLGISADIHFEIGALARLVDWSRRKRTTNFHFWLRQKITHFVQDRILFWLLKSADAIVISECIPNGFLGDLYNVEGLRQITHKPVLFYEVFYLGNAPSQMRKLEEAGHPGLERYDWHLAVAPATETLVPATGRWSCIGLNLSSFALRPQPKPRFMALVDFQQPGYESYRQHHLQILRELKIETITLDRNYSISEIRELYRQAAVFFLETPEAFGVPIAECLSLGTRVYLPDSAWAMSWRLPTDDARRPGGALPDAFVIYNSWEDLRRKLAGERDGYDLMESPNTVFQSFVSHYPHFYYGNVDALEGVIARIQSDIL